MDRFIVNPKTERIAAGSGLKSNMDRFIGCSVCGNEVTINSLKSNMDRFIGYSCDNRDDYKQV